MHIENHQNVCVCVKGYSFSKENCPAFPLEKRPLINKLNKKIIYHFLVRLVYSGKQVCMSRRRAAQAPTVLS